MMEHRTEIRLLIDKLLLVIPEYRKQAEALLGNSVTERRLLRSLMNVFPPERLRLLGQDFWTAQDALLSAEREEKGIVDAATLPEYPGHSGMVLWQGDITRLRADAIVNAANEALLGCFCPCHGCIDNAIHSAAGLQLRRECHALMTKQGHPEPTGKAKLTKAYNLPAKYILHTVGPIVQGAVTAEDEKLLRSCYRSCLEWAEANGLTSVAFCCISTGEFHFPNRLAAEIAIETVEDFLQTSTTTKKVIFNVFKDQDAAIYQKLLR